MKEAVLTVHRLSKDFGHVRALDNVDFELVRGEIHALLGVNGAGKSTLTKILSGIYQADSGDIVLDGRRESIGSPGRAKQVGIASVQQHPELVSSMTCYENILLGQESAKPGLFRRVDRAKMLQAAQRTADRYHIDIDLTRRVASLSSVEKELLSILHALIQDNTKILLLDEPTSILTEAEQEMLFGLMRTLCERGISIIYITHHLEEVFEISDRFTVFRNGQRIVTMETAKAKEEKTNLADLMLGRPMDELYPTKAERHVSDRAPVLRLEGLNADRKFQNVTLEARRGEILGIFGLVGSGIHELGDAIFGISKHDGRGKIYFNGTEVRFKNAGEALKGGIFLLPGDRRTQGLSMDRDSVFNTTLANLGRSSNKLGLDRPSSNRRDSEEILSRLDLSPMNVDVNVSSFSGGNQQKVVLAKGLYCDAELYIFVEPTVGVDVGARAKIYSEIRSLANEKAVIVISSDCDEVFGLGDRVVSFFKGRPVGSPDVNVSRDELLHRGVMGQVMQ